MPVTRRQERPRPLGGRAYVRGAEPTGSGATGSGTARQLGDWQTDSG
ncbi:hypothetical protein [Streptomyces sp. 3211]|nr:hypothetical protein [Streptomyces sp. 3211]